MTLPTTDRYGRDTGPTWPATMPGADDDPHGERGQAASLLDSASRDLEATRADLSADALPAQVRGVATKATKAIAEIRGHVHAAAADLDALAANDLIPDKGRDRLLAEKRAAATQAVHSLDSMADVALTVLEAGLTKAAQPAFPADADRPEARERFRMLVDGADDPAAMVRELVGDPAPELAAIAASGYARDYLRSKGVAADVIEATATFAAQQALTSSDPGRQAAARALTRLPLLRKARQQSLMAASFAIGFQ